MGWHVIRAFGGVAIVAAFLGQACEKIPQILLNVGIGIFLDQKRSRGVANEARKKAVADFLVVNEFRNRIGEFVKPRAMGRDLDRVKGLFHSRFRK